MAKNNLADLSTTSASNTDILGQSTAGTALASTLDTIVQNALAVLARFYDDLGGTGAVGGTADAITLTSGSVFQSLASGLVVAFKAGSANTTAATINVDSLGAKAIRKQGDSALVAGDIAANGIYLLRYDTAYNSAAGAWVLLNLSPVPTFSDSLFRIQDNGDATKQLAFEVSGITTATTRTLTPPNASATIAALDVEDQALTGGARVTPKDLSTVSSGTVTPDPGDRPIQYYTNGGAHTLAPGSNKGSYILEILNNASAGAITTSGWTKVSGAFTTTNAHKFHCSCIVGQAYSSLSILALQ